MVCKAILVISVVSLICSFGCFANIDSWREPVEVTEAPVVIGVTHQKSSGDHSIQLSNEALRAFSIKRSPNQQQSPQRVSVPSNTEEKNEAVLSSSIVPSEKPKADRRINLKLVTSFGDEYSLCESNDSSVRFQVTHSRDLEWCIGTLRRVGQSTRFQGELRGVFREDPSHQVRYAPISIEFRGDQRSARIRTDYISWDHYGYEISRRSCVFQAACN
jgi:hypothetical protein